VAARKLAGVCSGLLAGLVAAIGAVAIELMLIGRFVQRGVHVEPGENVSWDPVSLWNQSALGKVMIGAPLVISALVFALTFWFVCSRVTFYTYKTRAGVKH
jgi:hypothetical protein